MFLWYPVLDLARAPRRTARKKGSGYENGLYDDVSRQPRPQGLPRGGARAEEDPGKMSRVWQCRLHEKTPTRRPHAREDPLSPRCANRAIELKMGLISTGGKFVCACATICAV